MEAGYASGGLPGAHWGDVNHPGVTGAMAVPRAGGGAGEKGRPAPRQPNRCSSSPCPPVLFTAVIEMLLQFLGGFCNRPEIVCAGQEYLSFFESKLFKQYYLMGEACSLMWLLIFR